jgi:plasmid stabilization system protein ParE
VTDPLRIEITEDARAQIADALAWWSENRPAARGAVLDELDRTLNLLTVHSALGSRSTHPDMSGVRRVLISRIHYYVYYRVKGDAVQVLAFWHSSRGRGPKI